MTLLGTSETGVSIVIPAWNEGARIGKTLDSLLAEFEATASPFEVIVVSDGSTDDTAAIAARFSSRGVRLLDFPSRLGKGDAVMVGLRDAKFDRVGFLDADGPVAPQDIIRILKALDEFDGAIASRYVRDGSVVSRRPFSRAILSRLWNLAARGVLLVPVRDFQCGAKFFRSSVLKEVLPSVAVSNWAFDASLIFHFHELGFRLQEVPVKWSDSSGSKVVLAEDVPSMLISLVGVRVLSKPFARRVSSLLFRRATS